MISKYEGKEWAGGGGEGRMEGEISERKKEQLATVIMYTTVQNK